MADILTPLDIQKAMLSEWMRMKKVIAEAEALKPKLKRAERFIRELSEIWNLALPQDMVPKEPVALIVKERPQGITVDDSLTCPEPNCGRSFEAKHGFTVHRNRASCEISGGVHGKSCPNHRGTY